MKKPNVLFFLCILTVCSFYACKKSSDSPANAITGNYNFVSLHANTTASNQYTDAGVVYKTVTTSEYTTTGNAGTIVIDGSKMTAANLGYTMSTIAHGLDYEDGILIDSIDAPVSVTLPPTNSVSTYTLNSSDSLTFTGAAFINSGNAAASTGSTGARYTLVNGTLTITAHATKDTVINSGGIAVTEIQHVDLVTTLQKQ